MYVLYSYDTSYGEGDSLNSQVFIGASFDYELLWKKQVALEEIEKARNAMVREFNEQMLAQIASEKFDDFFRNPPDNNMNYDNWIALRHQDAFDATVQKFGPGVLKLFPNKDSIRNVTSTSLEYSIEEVPYFELFEKIF